MRIASLVPSGTALTLALGLQDQLCAVTDACAATGRPVVVRSAIDSGRLDSAEIDRQVSAAAAAGESPYRVDEELLRRLAPDLVLTQDTCPVCALPGKVARVAAAPEARVISLSPHGLEDVLADVARVAAAAGVPERGRALAAGLRARAAAVAARVARLAPVPVVCLEWLDPPWGAGHWLPEMVSLAGGADPLAEPRAMSRRLTWPEVFCSGAHTAICLPCSLDLERAIAEARAMAWPEDWAVWATDGGRLFSSGSPALWDGLEILAAILHPEAHPIGPDPALAQRVQ
ncbi:MAG TPA: cobalamin-binding protein [Bacillota bacterium]|nr:cobalamin-binding protein [Bacillota bacterium]